MHRTSQSEMPTTDRKRDRVVLSLKSCEHEGSPALLIRKLTLPFLDTVMILGNLTAFQPLCHFIRITEDLLQRGRIMNPFDQPGDLLLLLVRRCREERRAPRLGEAPATRWTKEHPPAPLARPPMNYVVLTGLRIVFDWEGGIFSPLRWTPTRAQFFHLHSGAPAGARQAACSESTATGGPAILPLQGLS